MDLLDFPTRNAAPNRAAVQHSGQGHIVDIPRAPGDFVASLLARDRSAHNFRLCHSYVLTAYTPYTLAGRPACDTLLSVRPALVKVAMQHGQGTKSHDFVNSIVNQRKGTLHF
jgi:hypothetical protein